MRWMRVIAVVGVSAVVVACGGAMSERSTSEPKTSEPKTSEPKTCGIPPEGGVVDLKTPTGDGTRFGPPELVWNRAIGASEGSIEVRGAATGSRTLSFGGGCVALPELPGAGCPAIEGGALLMEAERRLGVLGIRDVTGPGPGVGAEPLSTEHGAAEPAARLRHWRLSLLVRRWADADVAIATVAAVLDEYDAVGSLWVSVMGVVCADVL